MKRVRPLTSMDTVEAHDALRRRLAERMGTKLLFASTERELCEHIVELMDIPTPIDVHDMNALSAECKRLMDAMGRPCVATSSIEVFATFLREVMAFAELPITRRLILEREVKADIATLDALLAKYAQERVVQEHLAGERARDHQAHALVTFYDRCVAQKTELVRYLDVDLDAEALTQCTVDHHEMLKWMPLVFGPRLPIAHPRALARFRLLVNRRVWSPA